MIELFYSTVGMCLDLLAITYPLLNRKKLNKRELLKTLLALFLATQAAFYMLQFDSVVKYITAYLTICYVLYKLKDVKVYYLYMYVMYSSVLFMFDYIGYLLMDGIYLLVYSVIYKVTIIMLLKSTQLKLDHKLKMKMLSGASITLIILLSILVGGA